MKAYILWPIMAFFPGTILFTTLCLVAGPCKPEGWIIDFVGLGLFAAVMCILGIVFEKQRSHR